ncbi:MAG TPA: DDE-type integrase/transposase/recombinase [Thiolinea sp.]|nr:DDE-type integrase/transposase/recombinase [Thiolinea sp.]
MGKPTTEELVMLAQQLRDIPHSGKGAFVARHATNLQVTPKTLYGWLRDVMQGDRKPRSDNGTSALTLVEARLISALLRESRKQTGKQLGKVGLAVDMLRSNGAIRAESLDRATGALRPFSISAIERALRGYRLHPDQLDRPAPAQALRSPHPNYLWQVDASLCVLYYLPRNRGLAVMDSSVYYHNKPGNLARVENDRVWRYAVTDHASGTVYVEYVYGGESGENLSSIIINAMQYRGRNDPFHGVPHMIMLDPGSANTGALFKNLCATLGIQVQINAVHNPRAKGQVEGMHNIIERDFESRLKLAPVKDLDELNQRGWQWMRHFNSIQVHRRHGQSRYAAWMRISASQLIKAPSVEVCRSLTHEKPESRVVNGYMQISWRSGLYDVGHVPGLNVGDRIDVARNPWKADSLRVITTDAEGRLVFHEADLLRRDDYGFVENAATVGQEYKRHAASPAETAQQVLDKLAMDADSVAELEGRRKAKAVPFGGRIDPHKPLVDASPELPDWMEKRGQESALSVPDIRLRPCTLVEAAKILRADLGENWLPEYYTELQARYPDGGVPQEDIDQLKQHFRNPPQLQRPTLRIVGGA